jgi:hypothetical protein
MSEPHASKPSSAADFIAYDFHSSFPPYVHFFIRRRFTGCLQRKANSSSVVGNLSNLFFIRLFLPVSAHNRQVHTQG